MAIINASLLAGALDEKSPRADGADAPAKKRPSVDAPPPAPEWIWDPLKMKDLESLAILGKGGFSCVTLVRHVPTKKVYGLKAMAKSLIVKSDLTLKVINEKEMLERLRGNPFCLQLFQTNKDYNYLYLLTEVADGGDLMAHMVQQRTLSRQHTQFYAACLLRAIEHCHACGFVHRDIKVRCSSC
jgi:serine/threonine protein kinase